MSESQQGPDICDVISAKRYWVTYCCDHRFQKPTFDDFSKNEEDSFAKNVYPHLLT